MASRPLDKGHAPVCTNNVLRVATSVSDDVQGMPALTKDVIALLKNIDHPNVSKLLGWCPHPEEVRCAPRYHRDLRSCFMKGKILITATQVSAKCMRSDSCLDFSGVHESSQ